MKSPYNGQYLTLMSYALTQQQTQISGVLFQLKDSPQVLEDVLERVNNDYGPDLNQLIRTMLRRAFHQRLTMKELIELPLVQECLKLSNSPLYKTSKSCSPDGEGKSRRKRVQKRCE